MTTTIDSNKPKGGYPWRRFFARGIDHSLYSLLWYIPAFFILHWDISEWTLRNAVISFALMILVEPLIISAFATTPGKAIFGIRIKNVHGQNITLAQSYSRVWGVFGQGYGYGIPIYSLVRQYKSYKECKENNTMDWDYENNLTYSVDLKMLPLRGAICTLCIIILAAIPFMLPFAADMPKHRGELTTEQFLENVERYARFHGIDDEERASAWMWTPPPELIITETNGIVTAIEFEIIDGSSWDIRGLEHWVRAYVVSFVGAQEGVNFWNLHIARESPMRAFFPHFTFEWGHTNRNHTAFGIEMIYEIDIDWEAWEVFRPHVDVRFSMRKVDGGVHE